SPPSCARCASRSSRGAMADPLRTAVLRLLRVPPEPEPPAGDPGSLRVFRAAPNYLRYRLALWGIAQASALAGLVVGLLVVAPNVPALQSGTGRVLFLIGEAIAWASYVVQLAFSYVALRLDYDMRWYILSDRALRIREGVLRVREKTMTFVNIQQISIRQNPLQRVLGIADVHVRTAGGGAKGEDGKSGEAMHEGFFHGVENAPAIRDLIRDRVRRHRDSGLGDPDDAHAPVAATGSAAGAGAHPLLAAAAELRREAGALRVMLVRTDD
ncbi:MAG: PH domain-containing protein, partial [Longimicrobiales bacterium]